MRALLGRNAGIREAPLFKSRDDAYALFLDKVSRSEKKLQIGVRGKKIAEDWFALDLYDKSKEIDYHYDIQNLPFENDSFDCVVCKAILEHVREAELAVYELYRILRPGGQIWVEVPFLQAYNAHPFDFWRCTLQGLRRWLEDFDETAAGIFEGFAYEAGVLFQIFSRDLKLPDSEVANTGKMIKEYINSVEEKYGKSSSLYMASFFWGEKPSDRKIPEAKIKYFEFLKNKLNSDSA